MWIYISTLNIKKKKQQKKKRGLSIKKKRVSSSNKKKIARGYKLPVANQEELFYSINTKGKGYVTNLPYEKRKKKVKGAVPLTHPIYK